MEWAAGSGDNRSMDGLGKNLRSRARELGLTDAEVARRVGLSQSRYANYVVNKREPDFATFIKICRVLGTTPNHILGFNEDGDTTIADSSARETILNASHALCPNALRTLGEVAQALLTATQAAVTHDDLQRETDTGRDQE